MSSPCSSTRQPRWPIWRTRQATATRRPSTAGSCSSAGSAARIVHYAVWGLRWAACFFAANGAGAEARACADALARIAAHTGHPDARAALAHALGETALLDDDAETAAEQLGRALELQATLEIPFERTCITGPQSAKLHDISGLRSESIAPRSIPVSTTLQQVPTDTYGVDPVHSSFGFGVRYNGVATFRSSFDKVDAQLADGVLTGSADVRSIVIDEPRFKDHLLADDFFDVENTPTITFRSTDIRLAEDGTAELDGDLTIRGVTKPVTAKGTFATGGDAFGNDRLGFEVQTTVDRREFGLNWQMAKPDGSEALAYDVTISAELQLVKQA